MFDLEDNDDGHGSSVPSSSASLPVLQGSDLEHVAQTIIQLFSPSTDPALAKSLQSQLSAIQATPDAWGLIAGLASHQDPNVRFFGAHTAQVKISKDWDSIPVDLHPALLALLLDNLAHALSPANPYSAQPANSLVVRKLFATLSSLILRLPFHLFPSPLIRVLETISSSAPEPAPRIRLYALEWLSIAVEEIGRAGISEQKRNALRRHLNQDLPVVMATIKQSMEQDQAQQEAACRCAEAWIGYGLDADELISLLPTLYTLLPLPAASSAIVEALSESVFRYGKGTRALTEPLIAWSIGPGVALLDGEPSEQVVGFAKLVGALVDHSADWIVSRIKQSDVQAFLAIVLRLTGWPGIGGVDENVSELTLADYPLLQEAIMDSDVFSEPHEESEAWAVAKGFFQQLVGVTLHKVRFPGHQNDLGMDKEDKEAFDTWRRDAGEVIVGAYYILRDEMLSSLTSSVVEAVQKGSWQDIEAALHCVRYSSEAVPLTESTSLPIIFGQVLEHLSQRPMSGPGEERLRLTAVCVIQSYEEWFKYHPEHLLPVLSYLVPSLTSTSIISRSAADALKALCDICRSKLVEHIGAFSQLHDKIGDLGPEEQTKVIQGITSVIQALSPPEAIGPVQGILSPIVDRLNQAVVAVQSDAEAQPLLVQNMNALTASFKGLSPSDDIFDLSDDEPVDTNATLAARNDARLVHLRSRIEAAISSVVAVWNGDGEVADSLSSLVKHSTLSSETLISLSPLPLLSLVTTAAERSSSSLWMSLASTLVLRINAPPSALTQKRDRTAEEEATHQAEEVERWNVVGDATSRLVVVAHNILGQPGAMTEHPDIVEGWFKFCSAVATRFPGVLLRIPSQLIEGYMTLGVLGLGTHERFSLKSACDFFISLFANTRYPSPLEPLVATLLSHFGPQILRAVILSAGSEGPRSVIPNLAELLARLVQCAPGLELQSWLNSILAEDGFPDPRATTDAKARLKDAVTRSRTARKMRETLHEFALVSRGLANTTYGNATAI